MCGIGNAVIKTHLIKNILVVRDMIMYRTGSSDTAQMQMFSWTKNDRFCMKLAYDWLRSTSPKVHWSKLVWSSSFPPKTSFILWLALKAKLPTKDRIMYMELDRKCELCGVDLESHGHLFFKCSFSSAVWNQIKAWLGLHCCMSSLASAAKWLKKETKGTSWISKLKRLGFITCVNFI